MSTGKSGSGCYPLAAVISWRKGRFRGRNTGAYKKLDLLNGNLKKIYWKYLSASFGSALIMSIYSLVDAIVIGRYEGPEGTAAVVTFSPMWSMLFAFGLLMGIGGSVLMAQKRGEGRKVDGDRCFTAAMLASVVISALLFLTFFFFSKQLLTAFGARGHVLELALKYAYWITLAAPFFVIGQVLLSFVRNDNRPFYTMTAAVSGGVFNIFGDIFFVFNCNMGISGAGLATAIGAVITFIVLVLHLFSKKNTLRFLKPKEIHWRYTIRSITVMGGSNFIIDLAMGFMAALYNNQILVYAGTAALAVYGVINTLSVLIQTFGYAVGEASQAIMSVNYGAGRFDRISRTFRYASVTSLLLGFLCALPGECVPNVLIELFMKTTPDVLLIAPGILRKYMISYILLIFNVNAGYYFQSIKKPVVSIWISLLRGILIGAVFIYLLPVLFGGSSIWYVAPLTELLVFFYILKSLRKESAGV